MRHGPAAALLLALLLPGPGARAQDPAPAAPKDLRTPRFVGPRSGKEREAAFRQVDGGAAAVAAVEQGLDWLVRHEEKGGGWDADGFPGRCEKGRRACDGPGKGHLGETDQCPYDDPITALGALALLGNGCLPDAKGDARAQALERALRRLEGTQDPWGLAFATEAFAEAEAMERKGRWRDAAARGAKALLAQREEDGGWAYLHGVRAGSDTPYTAAVVEALVTAQDAGVDLPKDMAEGVDRFLGMLEEYKGRLAYLKDARQFGYTPTTCNAHLGAAVRAILRVNLAGPRHRAHMAVVLGNLPTWWIEFRDVPARGGGTMKAQVGNLSLYQWYYGTLACFQEGGAAWGSWWPRARNALVGHQRREGCAKGSWDPEGTYERLTGGRVYATATAILILEEPWRHRQVR